MKLLVKLLVSFFLFSLALGSNVPRHQGPRRTQTMVATMPPKVRQALRRRQHRSTMAGALREMQVQASVTISQTYNAAKAKAFSTAYNYLDSKAATVLIQEAVKNFIAVVEGDFPAHLLNSLSGITFTALLEMQIDLDKVLNETALSLLASQVAQQILNMPELQGLYLYVPMKALQFGIAYIVKNAITKAQAAS